MEKSNFPVCTKIAIIGGGASGVALLKKLIDSLIDNMDSKIEISIFEKNDSLGPGLAYQDDVLTSLINRDAKLMSIDSDNPRDFIEWVSNILHLNEEIKTTFLPRALFGMYLQESLRGIVQIAKRKGIKLHISKNEIIEITKIKQQYMLKTRDREFMIFDQVAICIGNTLSQDPFQLRGQNHYIQNPYPLQEKLENIPTNSRVGIIGSGLTAVDIVLALRKQDHNASISLLSRNGELPRVRGITRPVKLQVLTRENLQKHHSLSLIQLTKLVKQEFESHNLNWRESLKQS